VSGEGVATMERRNAFAACKKRVCEIRPNERLAFAQGSSDSAAVILLICGRSVSLMTRLCRQFTLPTKNVRFAPSRCVTDFYRAWKGRRFEPHATINHRFAKTHLFANFADSQ